MLRTAISGLASLLLLTAGSIAQEKTPTPEKLKAMAEEAMKKADVKGGRVVETENLIVASALPEARAKALGDSLQKVYKLAEKTLKFEVGENKEAKVTVYAFPDLDAYRGFVRAVMKTRPEEDETASSDLKKNIPFVAVAPRRGDKNPSFETLAAAELARALLEKRGGNARLSEWMKDGFARAVMMRYDPKNAATDRSAVRRLAPALGKNSKANPVVDKAWSEATKDRDLIGASLMDFLTFGPGSAKLDTILSGLTPSDTVLKPTFTTALLGIEWKLEDLDRAWREWIAKGSPAGK